MKQAKYEVHEQGCAAVGHAPTWLLARLRSLTLKLLELDVTYARFARGNEAFWFVVVVQKGARSKDGGISSGLSHVRRAPHARATIELPGAGSEGEINKLFG